MVWFKNHFPGFFVGHFGAPGFKRRHGTDPQHRPGDRQDAPAGPVRSVVWRIAKAVVEGRLRAGDKLPSTRDLAVSLAVSRNTVSDVYERLAREGYLQGRLGSGTFVTRHGPEVDRNDGRAPASPPKISAWANRLSHSRSIVPSREIVHDFRPGLPDLRSFPIDIWRRLAAQNLRVLSERRRRLRRRRGSTPASRRDRALPRAIARGDVRRRRRFHLQRLATGAGSSGPKS